MFRRLLVLTLPLLLLFARELKAQDNDKWSSGVDEGVRGERGGFNSQQYHYTSYGDGNGPNGGGQAPAPSKSGSALDVIAADPVYALYLAFGFIILFIALGFIIYPILSEKSPVESKNGGQRSFRTYWDARTTERILYAIEKVYETYNN